MQSIGERLEEARKRKGITVREASEATKIRGEYLNNFEANTFKMNLPDIYVRGFLRSYANYLKVNSDKVITDYNAHLIGEGKSSRRDAREFLGRLELQQQPLVAEEAQNPGSVEDGAIESGHVGLPLGHLLGVDVKGVVSKRQHAVRVLKDRRRNRRRAVIEQRQ